MTSVLIACEIGLGADRLGCYAPLTKTLTELGHKVTVAARDVVEARAIFDAPVRIAAAPVFWGAANPKRPSNYSDLLAQLGLTDSRTLLGLLAGWDSLLELVRPDVVVLDSSPGAALATFGQSYRRIRAGAGAWLPPLQKPLPPIYYWDPDHTASNAPKPSLAVDPPGEAADKALLDAFSDVLNPRGIRLAAIQDLMRTDSEWHFDLPVDVYAGEAGTRFARPALAPWPTPTQGIDRGNDDSKVRHVWVHSTSGRAAHEFPDIVTSLGMSCWLSGAGVSPRMKAAVPNVYIASGDARPPDDVPLRLVVTDGGRSATYAAIEAGHPVLVVAQDFDTHVLGKRIEDAGLGAVCTFARQGITDGLTGLLAQAWERPASASAGPVPLDATSSLSVMLGDILSGKER